MTREAKFVLAFAYDYGWTTNVPIEYFLKEDSLFAFLHDGAPIPPEHGGPVRLIIPQLYAWKSAKWVRACAFSPKISRAFGKKAVTTCGAIRGRAAMVKGSAGRNHPQITQITQKRRREKTQQEQSGIE